MRRRAASRGLRWAVAASLALHLLAVAAMLRWPHGEVAPPPKPDEPATIEVVMGGSAEATGAEAAPPAPPAAPPEPEHARPEPEPPPPVAATEPASPPPPAAPETPPPAPPVWQSNALPGDGVVGAAEIIGERLRPAVGSRGNIPPGYPRLSAEMGEQGVVVVRMYIGADGAVTSAEVIRTSGYPRLDRAALAALAKWHFTPAVENGRPVTSSQDLPVRFRLD